REPVAGAWHGAEDGDVRSHGAGSDARKDCAPVTDRELAAVIAGRGGGPWSGLCRDADAVEVGVSRSGECADPGEPITCGDGVCVWAGDGDGHTVRRGDGMDCCTGETGGRSAQRLAYDFHWSDAVTARA